MSDVRVYVDGIDYTADVQFGSASFVQKCNGQSGDAYMRVRDEALAYSFPIGADWLVTVDGSAAWRGFVTQAIRTFAMDVVDLSLPGTQRFWDIRGADGNLLFDRRVVYDVSSPLTQGVSFPANTPDTTAITSLLSWLDLSADHIDTSSGVSHVAELDPEAAYEGWAGWKWGQGMDGIAMIPAAIYYLRPESGSSPRYTLVYCDADTATAPFGLSDQPDGVTTMGYREFEVTADATAMANDVLAYGYGYGSQTPVHDRITDATSVSEHGLWQYATVNPGVYRQATIDRIADSVVNGSPAHHRGAKDDRPQITCTTYAPGLFAGHIVDFACNQWGYSITIPVRQLTITFESPTSPRWDLVLSFEIDAPWQSTDPYAVSLSLPQFPLPGIPVPQPPAASGCDCVSTSTTVLDDFGRTVAPDAWGTATPSGESWSVYSPVEVAYSVNGSQGLVVFSGGTSSNASFTGNGSQPTATDDFTVSTSFSFTAVPDNTGHPTYPTPDMVISLRTYASGYGGYFDLAAAEVTSLASPTSPHSQLFNLASGIAIPPAFWVPGQVYTLEARVSAGTLVSAVYPQGSPSLGYTVDGGTVPSGRDGSLAVSTSKFGWPDALTVAFDEIDWAATNRCDAVQFDDFERTVASGLGNATPSGAAWSVSSDAIGSSSSVAGGAGSLVKVSTGRISASAVVPVTTSEGFSSLIAIRFSGVAYESTRFQFQPSEVGGSELTVELNTRVMPGTGAPAMVLFFDNPSADYDLEPLYPFSDGVWYWFRASYGGGTASARFWPVGSVEPSTWDLSHSTSGQTPSALPYSLAITNGIGIGPAVTLDIGSVDFDYASRPCYYDCPAPAAIDDFERTDATDLGTATPSGIAWSYFGTGSVAYSVDGHSGVRSYGSDLTGVLGTGARLALPTPYPEGVEFYAEFTASGEPTSGPSDWGENIAFGSGSAWDIVEVSAIPVGFSTTWSITAQNGPGTTAFRTSAAGTASSWWSVRVQRYADRVLAKAWLRDSESEPDWQIDQARSSSIDPSTAVVDWGGHGSHPPSASGSASLAIVSAGVAGCVPVAPSSVASPVGPTGYGCEVPTASSSTLYTTTAPFVPGSLLVWRAGLLQRPGTDYTEGTDSQSFTFTTAISGEEVRCCYLSAARS